MERSWWHSDPEEEGVRWFEVEEDEFMDALLDFDLMFKELGLTHKGLDIDNIIQEWFNAGKY